jgi:HD-GYP domain-containing protein (c-di-GMP phosphodiesterase class II)
MSNKADKKNYKAQESHKRLAEELLRTLYSLLRAVKIYHDNNKLVADSVTRLIRIITQLLGKDESLTIKIVNDRFFVQDEKVLYGRERESLLNTILHYFEERHIDGLRVSASIKNVSHDAILDFSRLVNEADQKERPDEWLGQQAAEKGYTWIAVIGAAERNVGVDGDLVGDPSLTKSKQDKTIERKEQGRKDYSYALTAVKEVSAKLFQQQRVGIRKTLRLVQSIVEHILGDESIYLALSTVRAYDDYTYTHSVNVSLLAMCLGKKIGLSRHSLERLGLCGLFHDLGKLQIPLGILNKPGKLSNREFEIMEKHSLNSVRLIMRLNASHDRKVSILLAPFEHHLKYNLQGYPQVQWKKPISLFGRILAIADVFDALTSPRVYRNEAISPDRALGMMTKRANKDFDPILLKVFMNMLGMYPLGTLVLLENGEMGLVSAQSAQNAGRPMLILLVPAENGRFKKGKEIDLADQQHESNTYLRKIVKTEHPAKYGIQPAEYIL